MLLVPSRLPRPSAAGACSPARAALALLSAPRLRRAVPPRRRPTSTTSSRNSTAPGPTANWPPPRRPPRSRRRWPALTAIAAERAAHAQALSDEIIRMTGQTPRRRRPATSQPPRRPTAATPARRPPTPRTWSRALRRRPTAPRSWPPKLSGYRAGLLGSIAAACTAAYTVALTPAAGVHDLATSAPSRDPTARDGRRRARCSTRSPPSTAPSTATGWCPRTHARRQRPGVRAMAEHRERREEAIAMLAAAVRRPTARRRLSAADRGRRSGRSGQAGGPDGGGRRGRVASGAGAGERSEDRAFAVTALTECAVTGGTVARCSGIEPSTVAFPGGTE